MKIVNTLLLILLFSYSCVDAGQNEDEIDFVFQRFLNVLKAGDVDKLKSISSPQGFESLVGNFPEEEHIQRLKNYGVFFDKIKEREYIKISENEIKVLLGERDPVTGKIGFIFTRTNSIWIFNKFLPGK